jgi:polysaccharide deacetylase 2 family uncharacterized protein YibQ
MPPKKARKGNRRDGRSYLLLFGCLALLALVLLFLERARFGEETGGEEGAPPPEEERSRPAGREAGREGEMRLRPPAAPQRDESASEPPGPAASAAGRSGRVALIVDDVGQDEQLLDLAASIPFPVSYSVLPLLPCSASSAERLHRAGFEILLHLPMEPEGYPADDPGPGALLTSMSPEEIRRTVAEDLDSVPHVAGVNNHMGSLFCQREDLLEEVFEELRRQGLFFVDSRTTAGTVALRMAREQGLRAAERAVFLDQDDSRELVHRRLAELFQRGRREGAAIGIGHFRRPTLEELAAGVPRLRAEHPEITVEFVSALVAREGTWTAGR